MIKEFLAHMKTCGWTIEMNETPACSLPEPIGGRYQSCPLKWMEFIAAVKSMVSGDEQTWFLCADDYDIQGDKAFQWNEWEIISLNAAEDDAVEINRFWNKHLPIVMSVKDEYSYYALSMEDSSVVYGAGPEFENCKTAASSFEDFLEQIIVGQIQL